jgi:hypothetical protein
MAFFTFLKLWPHLYLPFESQKATSFSTGILRQMLSAEGCEGKGAGIILRILSAKYGLHERYFS